MLKLKDQDNPIVRIYGLKEIGYGKKIPEPIKIAMDVGKCPNTINNIDQDIGKIGEKENIGCLEDGISALCRLFVPSYDFGTIFLDFSNVNLRVLYKFMVQIKTQIMKKVFLGLLVAASFAACTSTETKPTETVEVATTTVEHLYKPTYTDNFKMGDQKNVMLAEQFHKVLFEKDFKAAGDMMSDTATMNAEDGSVLNGKAAIIAYMEKSFAGVTFKNFQIAAIYAVVGENGHQWVDIWDEADLVFADGKTQKVQWMDAFRFEGGKIVHFVGFGKAVK